MTGWGIAVAPAAVAAAVLLVPGLLVGRAAGLKGLLWTAAAPALSVGVVALVGNRALCRWFVDGDVDGDEQEAWIDLAALTVL